mmetsp:Transcript_18087/g.29386  ORF Transcript_18087/g.29386 Transcript_18087/m.29386 type:complete len:91 (+) Transcript_18087:54-326(+)
MGLCCCLPINAKLSSQLQKHYRSAYFATFRFDFVLVLILIGVPQDKYKSQRMPASDSIFHSQVAQTEPSIIGISSPTALMLDLLLSESHG